jgi:hypothetical protein
MISFGLNVGRSSQIEIPPRLPRVFSMLGLFWVCLGLNANEWTVPIILGIDPLGPRALMLIRILNLAAISWGLCTLRCRSKAIVQNLNLFFCVTILTAWILKPTRRKKRRREAEPDRLGIDQARFCRRYVADVSDDIGARVRKRDLNQISY